MTNRGAIRRGLPRFEGGEPWPPEAEFVREGLETGAKLSDPVQLQPRISSGAASAPTPATDAPVPEAADAPNPGAADVPVAEADETASASSGAPGDAAGIPVVPVIPGIPLPESSTSPLRVLGEPVVTEYEAPLRRGLPRVAGGEAWPPEGTGTMRVVLPAGTALDVTLEHAGSDASGSADPGPGAGSAAVPAAPASAPAVAGGATAEVSDSDRVAESEVALRRGLPRTAGGEPWPPAGTGTLRTVVPAGSGLSGAGGDGAGEASAEAAPAAAASDAASSPASARQQPEPQPERKPSASPSAGRPAAKPAEKPAKPKKAADPEKRALQIKMLLAAAVGAVVAVAGVMIVRALLATEPLQEFLARYPGEYHLPETAEPGFPAWAKWTHFLNFFFMVQIVRSGLQVRTQKKPDAYWTPKRSKNGEGKISLALWFHQSLDILWLANGIVFVVLLFVSGHWMRIVPTSWEVFPNAASAMLQYISLDWPTEDGWVNYNSLQQLMYFIIVFVAAPLAAISGFRMSGMWSKKWKRLSEIYPVEVARAIHFPTMLFFVFFVIVHVVLVFTTGALKNLNHMFGEGPVVSWVGLGFFALGMAAVVGMWVAARPLILAPIASLFGRVSNR